MAHKLQGDIMTVGQEFLLTSCPKSLLSRCDFFLFLFTGRNCLEEIESR